MTNGQLPRNPYLLGLEANPTASLSLRVLLSRIMLTVLCRRRQIKERAWSADDARSASSNAPARNLARRVVKHPSIVMRTPSDIVGRDLGIAN